MSLLSNILLPLLEHELKNMEPLAAEALVRLLKNSGQALVDWAEKKLNVDINGDGKIGSGG